MISNLDLKKLKRLLSQVSSSVSGIANTIIDWTNILNKPTEFPPESHAHDDLYLNKENTVAFTPDADYEPATKKYVDDTAGGININSLTEKTAPVDDDIFVIEDSADTFNKKKLKVSNLPSYGGGGGGYNPPLASEFTEAHDGASLTISLADGIDGLSLSGSSAAGNNDRIAFRGKNLPGGNWTLEAKVKFDAFTIFHRGGICISNGTRFILCGIGISTGVTSAPLDINFIAYFNNVNSFHSTAVSPNVRTTPIGDGLWWKCEDNGTNIIISISNSGANWIQLYSASRTVFLDSGPTKVGMGLWFFSNTTLNRPSSIVITKWKLS